MSEKLYLKGLLQKEGWLENVEVVLDDNGIVTAIEPTDVPCSNFALPGFYNSHSHAFQYAMAGTAENHLNPDDDFWSWRKAMYKLALQLDPDQMESIAAMVYSEMIRHGYTHVAEFHYLHHDEDGKPYENSVEMGQRMLAAASRAGINITLLPVFYSRGGFGKPALPEQKRFLSSNLDEYLELFNRSANACKYYEYANVGVAVHSLRAVRPDDIVELAENGPPDVPFHMHIAEQAKEVEECLAFHGVRPVRWLLDHVALSDRFQLVHATHMDENETCGGAISGANVVICPTTEGNLGDGFFDFERFKNAGGSWSIGTDSHVSLNPFEELRFLDYGQRLASRSRNTFGETGSSYAVTSAFDAGRNAMGKPVGNFFEAGELFNACLISSEDPLIGSSSPENRLNTIVYSSDESMQIGSVVNGVRSERLNENEKIRADFLSVVQDLKNR